MVWGGKERISRQSMRSKVARHEFTETGKA